MHSDKVGPQPQEAVLPLTVGCREPDQRLPQCWEHSLVYLDVHRGSEQLYRGSDVRGMKDGVPGDTREERTGSNASLLPSLSPPLQIFFPWEFILPALPHAWDFRLPCVSRPNRPREKPRPGKMPPPHTILASTTGQSPEWRRR